MKYPQLDLTKVFWFQEGPGVRNWQFTESGIKLLNVANITNYGNIDLTKTDRCLSIEEVDQKYKHFLVDEGDLVIASSGISFDTDGFLRTRGAFIQKKHLPLCMNTSTIRFKAKDETSDLLFLKYWLDSFEFREQITRLVTGSAQQNFGPSHLKQLKISLPPLEEQKRIAKILTKADKIRRTRRYALELSDTYLQSVFLEMFGDPVTNSMGWDVVTISDISQKVTDGTHQPPLFTSTGIPFIFVQHIVSGKISFKKTNYVSEKTYNELTRNTKIELHDILYSSVGSFGVAVEILTKDKFVFQRHIAHIKPNHKKINSTFLCSQMNTDFVYNQAKKASRGVAQATINLSDIKELKIIYPPLELQEKFAKIVQKYERIRKQQQEAQRQADHLFQSLLHQFFSQ